MMPFGGFTCMRKLRTKEFRGGGRTVHWGLALDTCCQPVRGRKERRINKAVFLKITAMSMIYLGQYLKI